MATWNIDSTHTSADFSVRHMMVSIVRGTFKHVAGTITYDPAHPENASVDVSIDANSIYTGVNDRDNHLRSADFLEVDKFPAITFKSTNVEVRGETEARITGDLTIRDVTLPVVIDAEMLGFVNTPFGDERVGFTGTAKINREDFGLTWNMAIEAGGVVVGKELKLELNVEAIRVLEPVR
jgi:polyisoprenoid-binding protein YceI